jgi:tetratricopeptide (TPR) repeat protein
VADDFERYKNALKAGHVALLRGRFEEAVERYAEAGAIAPDRPLPHSSHGSALLRLGRLDEALAAYARALGRAPRDEAALAGRAEALLAAGRKREAAEVLERLADVQSASGLDPEALATLRRATGLAETRRRRRRLTQLTAAAGAPAPEATIGPVPEVAGEPIPAAAAEPSGPPLPDPLALLETAESASGRGDVEAALVAWTAASDAFAAAGAADAAIDVCLAALQLDPGRPAIHLSLARRYLERGWRELAADKVRLLGQLLELDGRELDPRDAVGLAGLMAQLGPPA